MGLSLSFGRCIYAQSLDDCESRVQTGRSFCELEAGVTVEA